MSSYIINTFFAEESEKLSSCMSGNKASFSWNSSLQKNHWSQTGTGWTGKRPHMSSSRSASILSAHAVSAGITSSLPLHQTWRRPWRAWGRGSVYREARRVFRKNPAVNWSRSLGLNRPSTPGSSSCLPVYRHWTALWVSRFHLNNPAQGLKLTTTTTTTATGDPAEGNKTLLWADSCCPWARARDIK